MLVLLYKDLQRENAGKPPAQRIGFQAYCRKHGILAPEDWESIRKFEITESDLDLPTDSDF